MVSCPGPTESIARLFEKGQPDDHSRLESSCDDRGRDPSWSGDRLLSSVVASQFTHRLRRGGHPNWPAANTYRYGCPGLARAALTFQSQGNRRNSGPRPGRGPPGGTRPAKGLAFSSYPLWGSTTCKDTLRPCLLENPEPNSRRGSGRPCALLHDLCDRNSDNSLRLPTTAGEALDKLALWVGYPGGPHRPTGRIWKRSRTLCPVSFPGSACRRTCHQRFSGLKSAESDVSQQGILPAARGCGRSQSVPSQVLRSAPRSEDIVDQLRSTEPGPFRQDRCASIQLSGGVSCNSVLQPGGAG